MISLGKKSARTRSRLRDEVPSGRPRREGDPVEMAMPRAVVVSAKTPPEHSGAGLAAVKFAARMEARGRLAFLATASPELGDNDDLRDEALDEILYRRTERCGSGKKGSIRSRFYGDSGLPLIRKLWRARDRFEVVHCFSPTWFSFFAAIAARVLRKKLIVEVTLLGGDCPETSTKGDRFNVLRQRRMLQYRSADAIICITPALRDVCLRAGLSPAKIHVIGRAVNLTKFRPVKAEEKAGLRKKLGLPDDLSLILFVGGIIQRKGIDLLLSAFEDLASCDPKVGLVIVGPSHKHDEGRLWDAKITAMQREAPAGNRIFYPGWKTNVDEFMQACDVFAVPSRREGFGNVFIEAMATGLPTVCLKMPGVTDYIMRDGITGFIAADATPEAVGMSLVQALRSARGHDEDVGLAARQSVVERFSAAQIDARYESVYQSLFAAHREDGETAERSHKTA